LALDPLDFAGYQLGQLLLVHAGRGIDGDVELRRADS
jgi:hypothetical protein